MLVARLRGPSDRATGTVWLSPPNLEDVVVRWASEDGCCYFSNREIGSDRVPFLDVGSAPGESHGRVGNAIAVSIGDDCSKVTAPLLGVTGAARSTKWTPAMLPIELSPRREARQHRRSVGVQIEAFGGAPMSRGAHESVVKDCGGVVDIVQWSGGDQLG